MADDFVERVRRELALDLCASQEDIRFRLGLQGHSRTLVYSQLSKRGTTLRKLRVEVAQSKDAHFRRMQDAMRRYTNPDHTAISQTEFASAMIYNLDGPEQRKAFPNVKSN